MLCIYYNPLHYLSSMTVARKKQRQAEVMEGIQETMETGGEED